MQTTLTANKEQESTSSSGKNQSYIKKSTAKRQDVRTTSLRKMIQLAPGQVLKLSIIFFIFINIARFSYYALYAW